jgi:hypothetical protein
MEILIWCSSHQIDNKDNLDGFYKGVNVQEVVLNYDLPSFTKKYEALSF